MSIAGLLFFVGALLICAGLVAWPLLQRRASVAEDAYLVQQRDRLQVYYERVLTNLRDLDEDHATGKMPTDAYRQEREDWVLRGVQVLRAMDTLAERSIIPAEITMRADIDAAIDSAIEASITAYRQQHETQG